METCPICLEVMDAASENHVKLKCGHSFHRECVLNQHGRKCALCRATITENVWTGSGIPVPPVDPPADDIVEEQLIADEEEEHSYEMTPRDEAGDLPALGGIAPTHIICDTCGMVTLVSVLIPQRSRRHFIKTTSPHPRHTRVCLGWVVLLAVRTAFHRLAAVAEVREHGGFAWVGGAERSRSHIVTRQIVLA